MALAQRALLLRLLTVLGVLILQVLGQGGSEFTFEEGGDGLLLGTTDAAPTIYIDSDDLASVQRVAKDLSADLERVLGAAAEVSTSATMPTAGPAVIIGTIEGSALIKSLVDDGTIDVSEIEGKWESYVATTISDADGTPYAYVIAGSDKRGAVYGTYAMSEAIGVSPWYWWADVPSKKKSAIYAPVEGTVHGPPSVKFRGIFFNDEAPALMNWAKEMFPVSQYGNGFTSQFYEKAFELILRLKGNYLWPAMWDGMFYIDDELNGPLADDMGIFVGTSHHEPMARADKEQGRFMQGSWDWSSNANGVKSFMTEGAKRSKDWDTIYTLGMRGSGDAASATLTSQALVDVIKFQQETLKTELGKELSEIPQGWMMYKEVPGYWTRGMDVSEDVTLVWTDDNRGNIRRIPTDAELERSGGSGMYYHFDYVGSPRNYKWINTIQLQKTWEQMHLAYERGVQQIWIANVGDLKGLELPTNHFLEMAYDMSKFQTPESTKEWMVQWATREFGEGGARMTADLMSKYGMLCARRKYEDLSYSPFPFSTGYYDEAEENLADWEGILWYASELRDSFDAETAIAFYEMVLHPIQAGKGVFDIYTKAALASRYNYESRMSTSQLADEAKDAFSRDTTIKDYYHSLVDGKWNHMMAQTHIGYDNWQEPAQNSMPSFPNFQSKGGRALGIGIQGVGTPDSDASAFTVMPMSPYMPPNEFRWLDVFLRTDGDMDFQITSSEEYVHLNQPGGRLGSGGGSSQMRTKILVDWDDVPAGESTVELTVQGGDDTVVVTVPLINPEIPATFPVGHIEFMGAVSIEAGHFSSVSNNDSDVSYAVLPEYGRTHSGAKLWPVTSPSQSVSSGPAMEFPFYTTTDSGQAKVKIYLSSSENADWDHPNRYAVSVDGKDPVTVQPTPMAADQGQEPSGWDQAVINNAWVHESNVGAVAPGEHVLRVWLLEPTMVMTKAVIDLGGVKDSLLGPQESYMIHVPVEEQQAGDGIRI